MEDLQENLPLALDTTTIFIIARFLQILAVPHSKSYHGKSGRHQRQFSSRITQYLHGMGNKEGGSSLEPFPSVRQLTRAFNTLLMQPNGDASIILK